MSLSPILALSAFLHHPPCNGRGQSDGSQGILRSFQFHNGDHVAATQIHKALAVARNHGDQPRMRELWN
jgi:hypothetical protein